MTIKIVNKLDELTLEALRNIGNQRLIITERIRTYLDNTNADQLRKEIGEIKSVQQLRIIQGAGVRKDIRSFFLSRYVILSGAQEVI